FKTDQSGLPCRKCPAFLQQGLQGSSAKILHPDSGPAVIYTNSMDCDYARMTDSGKDTRFVQAGPDAVRSTPAVRPANLESDVPFQLSIPDAVNVAKPAPSDSLHVLKMQLQRSRCNRARRRILEEVSGDGGVLGFRVDVFR